MNETNFIILKQMFMTVLTQKDDKTNRNLMLKPNRKMECVFKHVIIIVFSKCL